MAIRGQRDDVWEAVVAEWYPRGVPAASRPLRKQINGFVEDLRNQGATGLQIELWVIKCKDETQKSRNPWPGGGCTLEACAKHLNNPLFVSTPATFRTLLTQRFEAWKADLPDEWNTYVGLHMHRDAAYWCWLGAVGKHLDNGLKPAARKEWERLEVATKPYYSTADPQRLLRDEMQVVLKKYLPGGNGDEEGNRS
jgi:hypothetical protein